MEIRPRLTEQEYEVVKSFREQNKGIAGECEAVGIDLKDVNHYWYKGAHYSINAKGAGAVDYADVFKSIIEEMKSFAPKYPVIKRDKHKDNHLLIVDPADPHFGKRSTISETGEETNLITTAQRFAEGTEGLIRKTDHSKYDKIVLIGGNDALHTDNPFGTTTAGTKQDTAGLWHENFLVAKKSYQETIDRLLQIADVHFVFCPSNHDFMTGFFLADTLKSWYHNCPNITFDVTPIHRKYIQYGYSLIGATHGDGAKEVDLPDLIKTEAKKAWSESRYSYFIVHHVHHTVKNAFKGTSKVKIEKDYRNLTVFNTGLNLDPENYCFVESVKSISGTDRWHFTNGYAHSFKGMEAFIFHPAFGQVDKMTHLF
jgi:hypothetical protein